MPTMTVMTALVTFEGASALPRDRNVNTWHFAAVGAVIPIVPDAKNIAAKLADFYRNPSPSISTRMSANVNRTASIKIYWVDDPKPRPIRYQTTFAMGSADSTSKLPEEVALVASFYSVRNIPRHRGRVYLGPFGNAALATDGKPESATVTAIQNAGQRLIHGTGLTAGLALLPADAVTASVIDVYSPCVLSRKDNEGYVYTAGWIDNEWDVQRRRRIAATSRTLMV